MILSRHQKSSIDMHVSHGLDYATIEEVILSENPRDFILRTGKSGVPQQNQSEETKEYRNRVLAYKESVDILAEELYCQAKEKGEYFYWRAVEFQSFYNSRKYGTRLSLGEILPIVWEAERAVKKNYRVSAKNLSHILHLHERTVSAMLKFIDAPRSEPLIQQDEERIIEAYRSKIPQALVRHLYHLTQQKATRLAKEAGIVMPKREIVWYFGGHEHQKLDLVKASKIYNERDEGKYAKGITRRLGICREVYDYALTHRHEIEPQIMKAMMILYPDRENYTPYYLSPYAPRPFLNELVYKLCSKSEIARALGHEVSTINNSLKSTGLDQIFQRLKSERLRVEA